MRTSALALIILSGALCAQVPPVAESGFEDLPAGVFTRLADGIGTWSAAPGHAEIDAHHARGGRQSLHLLGGKDRQVELHLAGGRRVVPEIAFWAERWTRRAPFEFRVEVAAGGRWRKVHDGARTIRVGGFATQVRIHLDAPLERLRLTCTSPPASGVLIDDLRLGAPAPMEVVSVAFSQPVLPVLVGNRINPVARLEITTRGEARPALVSEIAIDLAGTTRLSALERVEIYCSGEREQLEYRRPEQVFSAGDRFGSARTPAKGTLVFRGRRELRPGRNFFWISVAPRSSADIDEFVDAGCLNVRLAGGRELRPPEAHPAGRQRLGIALRSAGDDGVAAYRIPGLSTTPRGTLIAVYDVRRRGWGDLPGDIDVGMSRSRDGGRTWEPMRIALDMGGPEGPGGDGVGDPCVLVDRERGAIWVAGSWSHGNHAWRGSGPGLEPEETGQLILARSDDDGRSWSAPINITAQVKDPSWCYLLQGPGRGITMHDGTLVFPAQFQAPPERGRMPFSTVITSRDHGRTWRIGSGARSNTTESAVVELEDGVLMLNMRDNRGGSRAVATSADLGRSWSPHPSSRSALPEPVCMASLINVDRELGRADRGRLLFCNPAVSRGPRRRISIKASSDGGRTWPAERVVLLDEGRSAGYSCLTMIDERTVGILYEGSRAHLTFQRIPLAELFGPRLELGGVFGEHMVLPRAVAVPIWGSARPGAAVALRFGGQSLSTRAGAHGRWQVALAPMKASAEPRSLRVESEGAALELGDVLVGDVWLCAGQSNMRFPLERAASGAQQVERAGRARLRLFDMVGRLHPGGRRYPLELLAALTAQNYYEMRGWQVSTPESAAGFSAVGWFFGAMLERELGVPIGLIHNAVGGAPMEAYIPRSALAGDEALHGLLERWIENLAYPAWCRQRARRNLAAWFEEPRGPMPHHPFEPGFLFAAGIEPLVRFPIRGVIWYQGESNATADGAAGAPVDAALNERKFTTLIRSWRRAWGRAELPFYFVQLPGLRRPWVPFREMQARVARELPAVGMAVAIDVGDPDNVHPRRKRPVGARLARLALAGAYGRDLPARGPSLCDFLREGVRLRLRFDHLAGGLRTADGAAPRGFEVAGADRIFHPAQALIQGEEILLSSPAVPAPRAARYAWCDAPQVNLVNGAGLPAGPFRTDSW